jgi:hypothetical protein
LSLLRVVWWTLGVLLATPALSCLAHSPTRYEWSNKSPVSAIWTDILGIIFLYSVWYQQVIAQLELWKEKNSGKYEKKVYVLPKHLDEKVAALHLGKLGARLTKLTKSQADYISVPIEGPYKPAHYRY